jgi:hypothetical protein
VSFNTILGVLKASNAFQVVSIMVISTPTPILGII